jgi:hypothetical protein
MTSAGSAEVAFTPEDSFLTPPGSPTWTQPGENVEVSDASLENALSRARQPDDPRPDGSREGNLEGALSVSWALTDTTWHDLVFPATGPVGLAREASNAPTGTWYIAADVLPGTEERFLLGAAVESMSVTYTQGEDVTVELTIIYADERDPADGDAPATPAAINQPSKDDIVRWHGFDLTVDGTTIPELQEVAIECSGMARFRRGQQREPTAAVVGAYEPSLSVTGTLRNSDFREYAYGSAGATDASESTIAERAATVTIDNPAGTLVTYNLSSLKPNSFSWSDLTSADTDITEPTEFHMSDIQVA